MATYWENSCSFGLRFVSWYMYLIVSLFFSLLGFWSGNLFLIAPFPDLCLLVPLDNVCATKQGTKLDGPCPLGPKETYGMFVPKGKAYTLLTDHLITGLPLRSVPA